MLSIPSVPLAAIVAAVITALVSLLGLIISKETKVSEFRQAWIDALRQDVAILLANSVCMYEEANPPDGTPTEEWRARRASNLLGVNEASFRIKLRLNPREAESQAVLKTLGEQAALFARRVEPDKLEFGRLLTRLVDEVQLVLKTEWDRVRSGEPVYRIARGLAVFATLVLVVFFVLEIMSAAHHP